VSRERTLIHSLVTRYDDDLLGALEADADDNERTVSQTIRFHLRRSLNQPTTPKGAAS
jgi:hypothetical protein